MLASWMIQQSNTDWASVQLLMIKKDASEGCAFVFGFYVPFEKFYFILEVTLLAMKAANFNLNSGLVVI